MNCDLGLDLADPFKIAGDTREQYRSGHYFGVSSVREGAIDQALLNFAAV